MPRVVGQDASVTRRVTCRKCGAINEYTPNEVYNFYSGTDYGGGPDGADGINCGQCGQRVVTKSW